ncbi:unnamed protein product [Candida verbasci]|uniref:N-acetyltransferase domain-containing protein n=1 Tax=Candida verbasci TaxID=1227364 RepID=A0A9W4TS66_9ASCO|nr:unnamed protein product [Candida verbasci]
MDSPPILFSYTTTLKDNTTKVTIYPILSIDIVPNSLFEFLCDEYNLEIERGETLPHFETLSMKQFIRHWFDKSVVGIMILGENPITNHKHRIWEQECLGIFNIKPNFPGKRCSHICSGEFLVNAGIRGKGIGKILTNVFLFWSSHLGYESCILNQVFETNVSARKLWESGAFNFKRVGKIAKSVYLKNYDDPVDTIIYGKNLKEEEEPQDKQGATNIDNSSVRFDKIKHYLQTGKYHKDATRQEKSRLRSSSSHYSIMDNKLYMKGKEVISNPAKQLEICQILHEKNGHCGINRCTSLVSEHYHWMRIKDSVTFCIKNCKLCKINEKQVAARIIQPVLKRARLNENLQQVIQQAQQNLTYADAAATALKDYKQTDMTTHVQSYLDE